MASRSSEAAPAKKQRITEASSDDELVRRAVELRSCEESGVTPHTLREVLRLLPTKIDPARDSPKSSLAKVGRRASCSLPELASLLCFDPGEPAQLLTELKNAWEHVKEPRPQHDQLQMRVV